MSYLERIAECNQYDLSGYIPFIIGDEQLGLANHATTEVLSRWPEVFEVRDKTIKPHSSLINESDISQATAPVFAELHAEGFIDSWVNELYPVVKKFGEVPRMHIERAATHYMGVISFGVHVNGLVRKADGVYVWVGKRTMDKPFWPGKLDQMVAGGQPAGLGLMENVIKESAEEANIPQELASQAEFITPLSYCSQGDRGINPDTLYVYDLWLPESFIPENTDGEVESFRLISLDELAYLVRETQEFKENCNLVNIDLLIRQGIVGPKTENFRVIVDKLYNTQPIF